MRVRDAAATIDQALAMIDNQAIDVAMLDINLSGKKSHPLAEALAARGVPFIYSTGNSDHIVRESDRDRPVLRKPFKYEDLVEMFTRLLSR